MTMTKNEIILIDKNTEDNSIKKIFHKYNNAKIFALDFLSENLLKTLKISYQKNDFLTNEDCFEIDSLTSNFVTNWYMDNNFKDDLMFKKIHLGNLVEQELYQYFLEIFSKSFMVKKIIDEHQPNKIISSTQINDYVSQICKQKNIEHAPVETKNESLVLENFHIKMNIGKFPISFKISRQKYHLLKNFSENLLFRMSNSKYNNSEGKKSILLFEFNPESYDELLSELSSTNKNILLLNTRRPAIWNSKTQKIITKNNCKVVLLDSYKKNIQQKISDEQKLLHEKLDNLFKNDIIFEKLFSINSFSLWSSLKPSFIQICNSRFLESIKRICLFKEFLSNSNISVILIWAETAQEEKELIQVAKALDIPIVLLQHAMAASEDIFNKSGRFISHLSYPSLTDKQAVWGDPAKKYSIEKNQNKETVSIGSPRHDKFFNFKTSSSKSNVILFAPTKPAPLFSKNLTINSVTNFIDFIKEVTIILKKFPEKKIIIKPHPTPAISVNVIEIAKQIDPKISFTYDSDILNLISNCELLITTNNSTIAIEAMMLKKPVISLQTETSALDENIVKEKAIISITEKDELESILKKVFFDDEFKKQILQNSNDFIIKYFSNPGFASKNLSKILDQY